MHARLPPPYKTMCRNYNDTDGVRSRFECYNNCLSQRSVGNFSKMHFGTLVPWNDTIIQLRPISPFDIANETFSEQLRQLEEDCLDICNRDDCNERYAVTSVSPQPNSEDVIVLVANVPRQPSYVITFQPMLRFIEFMVYCFSLVGELHNKITSW